MHRLFNLIAETATGESPAASVSSGPSWDPASAALCTAGLCILTTWLFWYGGFGALQKAPVRRHRRWFIFCPMGILFIWIISSLTVQLLISKILGTSPQPLKETVSYSVNAVLQISLITAMLIIVHKAFARRFRGLGIKFGHTVKDIPLAIVYLLAVFPLITMSLWATLTLGQMLEGPEFNLEVHQSLDLLTSTGSGTQILVIIFAVLIAPVFEELLFRGFFQTTLRSLSGKPWIAIIVTSVFFSILHPPTHIPALFFLSCGLGYAYERSGSLFRPILMHVFFNAFNVAGTLLLTS